MQKIKNISSTQKDRELKEKISKIYQKSVSLIKEGDFIIEEEKIKEKERDDFLYFWKAKEYEKRERSKRWYIIAYLILLAIVVFSFLTNNLLMSVLFVLIGLVYYFFDKREPLEHTFGITHEGVFAEDQIYEFKSLKSFWIFYDSNSTKELSLESSQAFMPYIEIPLGSADPYKIREILKHFVKEKEHNKPLLYLLRKYLD